ncbi:MAG TPA: hypothetical protein VK610_07850 [Rhodothermales bacterium]|nr:hypothetical protein [Rhodothermales bacterium]
MQQTLLAICALLVFSLYALSRHRADAENEREAMGGEVDLLVTEQARTLMSRVTALAYDEADIGATIPRTDPDGLTNPLGPETGETVETAYDDADDWNGYTATLTRQWDTGSSSSATAIALTASVAVRYVQPTNPTNASTSPTLAKEVVVMIVEAGTPQGRRAARATLQQVITPAMR